MQHISRCTKIIIYIITHGEHRVFFKSVLWEARCLGASHCADRDTEAALVILSQVFYQSKYYPDGLCVSVA